jgi:hypothetical protein
MQCGQYLYVRSVSAYLRRLPSMSSASIVLLPARFRVTATGEPPKFEKGYKFVHVSVNTHELMPIEKIQIEGVIQVKAKENSGVVTGWIREVDLSRKPVVDVPIDDGKPIEPQAFRSAGNGIRA